MASKTTALTRANEAKQAREGSYSLENVSSVQKPAEELLSLLKHLISEIRLLIENEKQNVAVHLRLEGRSRLARLVLNLPNAESHVLAEAAARDLPIASRALALASASSGVHLIQIERFADASRAFDIAMVMLGMPTAAPMRAVAELIDEHHLAESGHDLRYDSPLDTVRISEPRIDMIKSTLACAEVNANDLSLDQFRDFFRKDQPLVIRGCAASWPAVQNWKSPRYLNERYAHRTVPVELMRAGAEKMEEEFCALGSVLEMMLQPRTSKSSTVYLAQHPLFDYIPKLEKDIEHPKYIEIVGKERADLVNVWMGTAGSGSKLHFDSADNILVQVVGEKKVLLISHDQSALLYQKSPTDNASPIQVECPDLDKFPLFRKIEGVTATLRSGDGLYIPASHWHWVKALTGSVSVNFWF